MALFAPTIDIVVCEPLKNSAPGCSYAEIRPFNSSILIRRTQMNRKLF